jgi:hypothetical protein
MQQQPPASASTSTSRTTICPPDTQDQRQAEAKLAAAYTSDIIESFLESDWITINDGQTRTLEFLLGREKPVNKTDFNGNAIRKVQFIVIEADKQSSATLDSPREKKFELSRKHLQKLYEELKAGKTVLQITRFGQGKDTRYLFKGIR